MAGEYWFSQSQWRRTLSDGFVLYAYSNSAANRPWLLLLSPDNPAQYSQLSQLLNTGLFVFLFPASGAIDGNVRKVLDEMQRQFEQSGGVIQRAVWLDVNSKPLYAIDIPDNQRWQPHNWLRLMPLTDGKALYYDGVSATWTYPDGATGVEIKLAPGGNGIFALPDKSTGSAGYKPCFIPTKMLFECEGAFAGQVGLVVAQGETLADLEIGFRHRIVPYTKGSQTDTGKLLRHPLIAMEDFPAGADMMLTIMPSDFSEMGSNGIAMPSTGFKSTYRTILGDPVYLIPNDRISFAPMPDGANGFYLSPHGRHTIRIGADAKAPSSGRLRLGFSYTDTLEIANGDSLSFMSPGKSSDSGFLAKKADGEFVVATASAAMSTSWVTFSPSAKRTWRYFSPDMPLYTFDPAAPSAPRPVHTVATATVSKVTQAFPVLPFAGLPPPAAGDLLAHDPFIQFETRFVAPLRHTVLERIGGSSSEGTHAATREGWVAQFANGEITSLVLAQFNSDVTSHAEIKFDGKGSPLPESVSDALFAANPFIVATAATPDLKACFHGTAVFDGLAFDLSLPPMGQAVPTRALLIKFGEGSIKERLANPECWTGFSAFNDVSVDPDGGLTASWLRANIAQAELDLARGVAAMAPFVDAVNDPRWTGFLFFNAPLIEGHGVPVEGADVVTILADDAQLSAHHIGARVSGLTADRSNPLPLSAFFGLLQYVNPEFAKGDPVPLVRGKAQFDCILASMEIVIADSMLTDFHCSLYLVLNAMFGEPVAWVANADALQPTNSVLIRGMLQSHDGAPAFVFAADQSLPRAFYPIDGAIRLLQVTSVGVKSAGDDKLCFDIGGWFSTYPGVATDIASYEAVGFTGLVLWATMKKPDGFDCAFDVSTMKLSSLQQRLLKSGEQASAGLAAAGSVFRSGSLAERFPLAPGRILTGPSPDKPSDVGYQVIKVSEPGADCAWDAGWFGLELELPLAGSATATDALINGKILLAWPATSDANRHTDNRTVVPYFRLEGPGGIALGLNIAGVIEVGAHAVELKGDKDKGFTLTLSSIGVTVLSKTFPPRGTTNVVIGGIPGADDRSLGWIGSYVKQGGAK